MRVNESAGLLTTEYFTVWQEPLPVPLFVAEPPKPSLPVPVLPDQDAVPVSLRRTARGFSTGSPW